MPCIGDGKEGQAAEGWYKEKRSSGSVLKVVGTQTLGMYVDKRQEIVSEWVALRPIIKVCNR